MSRLGDGGANAWRERVAASQSQRSGRIPSTRGIAFAAGLRSGPVCFYFTGFSRCGFRGEGQLRHVQNTAIACALARNGASGDVGRWRGRVSPGPRGSRFGLVQAFKLTDIHKPRGGRFESRFGSSVEYCRGSSRRRHRLGARLVAAQEGARAGDVLQRGTAGD